MARSAIRYAVHARQRLRSSGFASRVIAEAIARDGLLANSTS